MAKRLPIDLELVRIAFDDRDGDGRWFLDGETGELLRLNECDDDDLADQIATGGERTLRFLTKAGMPLIATWWSSSIRSAATGCARCSMSRSTAKVHSAASKTYFKRIRRSASAGLRFTGTVRIRGSGAGSRARASSPSPRNRPR